MTDTEIGPRVPWQTGCAPASSPAKAAMDLKSFLLTLGIFCGGYVSNTLLDEVVGAAEKYFRVQTTDSYKTDSKGYIIYSTEKPKITNDNVRPLSLNASGERTPENH